MFEKFKQTLCEVPTLGIPDVNKEFEMIVHEDKGLPLYIWVGSFINSSDSDGRERAAPGL